MIKDIQKKILLKYPLIWNTKFVPMLVIGVLFNILYFVIGFLNGNIDFSGKRNYDGETTAIMFGILLSILTTIVWLVYYFKNNALKSFYSKSKNALFYEWLQIFIISFLLISFYIPFSIGKQIHERNYFSESEATKRCETIALADIFIDGYFDPTEVDSTTSILKDTIIDGEYRYAQLFYKDSMKFQGKKYAQYSLLNRRAYDFSLISKEKDSLNNIEVKKWLVDNQQHKIKDLMNNYLKIVNEHNLKNNLTTEKWFEEVYNHPHFTNFAYIRPYFEEFEADKSYESYKDGIITSWPKSENQNKYSSLFVQQDILKSKYDIVSKAHTNPFIEYEGLLVFLCCALGLSILIFSFRVTSGKSWLIAVVTVGVLNILFGILTIFFSSELTYFYLALLTFIIFKIYFIKIYVDKKGLGLSRIVLNVLLWSFPFMIPIIYGLIMQYYQSYEYSRGIDYISKEYRWLRDNFLNMLTVNLIICIIVLLTMSRIIRTWKGIAEE